jgi:hypothetical protein
MNASASVRIFPTLQLGRFAQPLLQFELLPPGRCMEDQDSHRIVTSSQFFVLVKFFDVIISLP